MAKTRVYDFDNHNRDNKNDDSHNKANNNIKPPNYNNRARFKEQFQYWQKKLYPYFKWTFIVGLGLSLLIGLFLLGLYIAVLNGSFGDVPTSTELGNIRNAEASEIYSADGLLLGKFFLVERSNADFEDIAEHVVDALIATEDARFYKHNGVDKKSLFRVAVKTILLRRDNSGGGSTISQQLAKNLYKRERYSPSFLTIPITKYKEMIIARRLEQTYSKKEIISLYLNTVPFGDNVFGIKAAAQRFFSKTPANLSVEEGAVLIGMLKANYTYNPRVNPEKSKKRRNVVLNQMVKYGYLSTTKAAVLKQKDIELNYNRVTQSEGLAAHLREQLRLELKDWCKNHKKSDGSNYNIYTDGLRIYTTIDSKMQQYAENAVNKHMTQLQATFNKEWAGAYPWGSDDQFVLKAMRNSDRYKNLVAEGKSAAEIDKIFRQKVNMSIFDWAAKDSDYEVERTMSPMDSIIHYQFFLNTGFMAMDAHNGQVKAWVGSINHKYFKFDYTQGKRQVGSTFKPIVYATALEKGLSPCKSYQNEFRQYSDYQDWTPRNADNKYGGYYSMKGALANSVNTVSVQVMFDAGLENVIQTAQDMGIVSNIPEVPSITLGTPEISLVEMIQAYSTFPNKGISVQPIYLLRVEDNKGRSIETFKPKGQERYVISEETANLMANMMTLVVDSGTAGRIRWRYDMKNDIAGKTGTTQNQTDGWFIGYTPDLVAGVWVGGDNQKVRFKTIVNGQGANMALPIWAEFMQQVYADPKFRSMQLAKFPALNEEQLLNIDCDLFSDFPIPEPGIIVDNTDNTFQNGSNNDDIQNSDNVLKPKNKQVVKPKKRVPAGSSKNNKKKSFGERFKDLFKKKN